MAKETKNIITRENCKNKLMASAKADVILYSCVLAFVSLFVLLPLAWGGICFLNDILILGIAALVLSLLLFGVLACFLTKSIIELRLIAKGSFSIVKAKVEHLSKSECPRNRSEGRHSVNAIYFAHDGRCTSFLCSFDLIAVGDEFYLVILHNKKKEIALAYPLTMYEFKELN